MRYRNIEKRHASLSDWASPPPPERILGCWRDCRPACYSISLHLKLIANGPSLLWKYVWTGKVHRHAVHSQDHISRNKKAHWLMPSYMTWFPTMLSHKGKRRLDFMYHIQLLMHPTPPVTSELPLIKKRLQHSAWLNSTRPTPLITFLANSQEASGKWVDHGKLQTLCFNKTEERKRENSEGVNTHILALDSAAHTHYMTPIWVFHPTAYFSGFKLGKLKLQATVNDSAEHVAAWSLCYSL